MQLWTWKIISVKLTIFNLTIYIIFWQRGLIIALAWISIRLSVTLSNMPPNVQTTQMVHFFRIYVEEELKC
jgi:hypothetical protein